MMWKIYTVLSILFASAAAYDWRVHLSEKWIYSVAYSFQGGQGRIFITRDKPIETQDDIAGVEKYIVEHNRTEGHELAALFLINWIPLQR